MTERPTGPSPARQGAYFVLHVLLVYVLVRFSAPWLAGWTKSTLLPMLGAATSSGRFEFLFTHLFAFSTVPAIVLGLANGKFRHRVALFVWVVPAVLLAYKLAVFPTSVLEGNRFATAVHYYFDSRFSIPEFSSWSDMFSIAMRSSDFQRGMDQLSYTAPLYAAVAYSIATWISIRTDLPGRVAAKLKLRANPKQEVPGS